MTPCAYKAKLTLKGDREMEVERYFNAPRSRVWKAMTDPTLVSQWWGRGNKIVVEKFEHVRGGHWRFIEHADGQQHGFEGRYREITPETRIVQSFEWDGMPAHVIIETMTLSDTDDGRTRMNLHSLFMTAEDRDGMAQSGMEGGMNQSYDALDRVLEKM